MKATICYLFIAGTPLLAIDSDAVLTQCTSTVFNHAWASRVESLLKPTCSSKSGTTIAYQRSLNLFSIGVTANCGQAEVLYRSYADAEKRFKLKNEYFNKIEKLLFDCRKERQEAIENTLGKLHECEDTAFANGLIMAGKFCGDMTTKMDSETYKTTYRRLCLLKRKEKECRKLTDSAAMNYLAELVKEIHSN